KLHLVAGDDLTRRGFYVLWNHLVGLNVSFRLDHVTFTGAHNPDFSLRSTFHFTDLPLKFALGPDSFSPVLDPGDQISPAFLEVGNGALHSLVKRNLPFAFLFGGLLIERGKFVGDCSSLFFQ